MGRVRDIWLLLNLLADLEVIETFLAWMLINVTHRLCHPQAAVIDYVFGDADLLALEQKFILFGFLLKRLQSLELLGHMIRLTTRHCRLSLRVVMVLLPETICLIQAYGLICGCRARNVALCNLIVPLHVENARVPR